MVIIGVSYLIGLLMFCVNFNDDTGVARILSGGARFSSKELTTFFCSSPSKDGLKVLNQPLPPPNLPKNVLKLTLALPGGARGVLMGALTNFPCKLSALGVQVHPLHPLATPMYDDLLGNS